jgi:enoyl-CoA hydratase
LDYHTIRYKLEEGVFHLILNQPPANRMDMVFFDELLDIVTQVLPSIEAKAIVIYGEGRHFSSGADLPDLISNLKRNSTFDRDNSINTYPDFLAANVRAFQYFDRLSIPVVAAIRGVCLGSALELAMFCHIRLCAKGAVLGFPESTFGILPGCGGVQKVIRLSGKAKAMELLLKGNSFPAEEALEWNIVDGLLSRKDVIEKAIAFAKEIAPGYKRLYGKEDIKKLLKNE